MDVEVAEEVSDTQVTTEISGERANVTGVHLVIRKTWNPFNPDIQVQLAGTSASTGEAIAEDQRH